MTENTQQQSRVFKIGSVRIVEDESLAGKPLNEVQRLLAPLYPQIENATVRERTEGDTTYVEFIARAGRKG